MFASLRRRRRLAAFVEKGKFRCAGTRCLGGGYIWRRLPLVAPSGVVLVGGRNRVDGSCGMSMFGEDGRMAGGGMPKTWKLCPTKVPPRSGPPSPERRGRKGWAGATLKSAPPPARPSSIRSPARESLTHSAIHNAPWAMHHHRPRLDDVLHSRARSRLGQMPSPIPRVSPCHSMQTGGLQMMAYTNGSRLDVKADHQLAWKSRPAMG